MQMTTDFEGLRKRFPVLENKTYLNSGSYCALADTVKQAFENYLDDRLAVGANWDVWIEKNEAVRGGVARLLNASPDEIAVTASVSAGLNALASAMDFSGPRNKVVITDFEFPTNAQIWHAQAAAAPRSSMSTAMRTAIFRSNNSWMSSTIAPPWWRSPTSVSATERGWMSARSPSWRMSVAQKSWSTAIRRSPRWTST